MPDFFRLKNAIGPAREIAPEDAVAAKTALAELGHYQIPDFGMTPYPDGALFEGVRKFQREEGLEVDGLMNPNGPTAQRLDAVLAERQAAARTAAPARSEPPDARPAATAEQAAANTRTLDGLLKSTDDGALAQLFARALAEGGPSSRAEYDDFLRQLSARAPERLDRFRKTVMSAVPDETRQTPAAPTAEKIPASRHNDATNTTEDRPTINEEKARIQNIIEDKPARFQIRRNPEADGRWRLHEDPVLGSEAVMERDPIIREMAEKHGVDPDLIRAVMWAENARGNKGGVNALADLVGKSNSPLPMNMNKETGAKLLGKQPEDLYDARNNIEAATIFLKRIRGRIDAPNPTPAQIGSMWLFTGSEQTNDWGEFIQRVYDEKPWERKLRHAPGEHF
ncbi:hypothetical protein [Shumkonia mesophila]|uniref:hypothetical protein n=1 Tax=Shumkonia mesophila TaxID=2838854 RepID=UPI002934B7A2|nr:hypothetical protein [Shumkonia mesophila]